MKLNVGDLVDLVYDGTTFSGVITAVTPERVEVAFTLNIFVEGPGRITWPNGADMDIDVGANALTKLHVRLPLEEVARVYAGTPGAAQPAAVPQTPAPAAETRDLLDELEEAAEQGGPPPEPDRPRARDGIWVDYDAPVDATRMGAGDVFPATMLAVSPAGCVVRSEIVALGVGDRVGLRFSLGRDAFDLAATVMHQEAPDIAEVAFDTLPSDVRVRMLRAVLGLAKPELRTEESWTYKLRQKGGA